MRDGGEPLRVLVVDDERIIADTLATIFRNRGFETLAAYSGESAITEGEQFAPDVLISDVVMGAMNGVELAMHISRRYPKCRVLLFSGQAATADLLLRADAQGFHFELLTKPVHPQVLLNYLANQVRN